MSGPKFTEYALAVEKANAIEQRLLLEVVRLEETEEPAPEEEVPTAPEEEILTASAMAPAKHPAREKPAARGEEKEEPLAPYAQKLLAELDTYLATPHLPPSCRAELRHADERRQVMADMHALPSFCSVELDGLLTRTRAYVALEHRIGPRYRALSRRYCAWKAYNGEAGAMETVPFDEHAIERLEALIAAEQAQAQHAAEQAYIEQALGEVMEDMGYDVLGSRDATKRSGKHIRSALYQYGEDTAINVTYSDNGQIALELGKLDKEDRVPTPQEGNALENQMVHFCKDFQEFEQRLKDKGVLVGKRIALAPPTMDYAQIINTNDYTMKEKKETARGAAHRAAAPKAFRHDA